MNEEWQLSIPGPQEEANDVLIEVFTKLGMDDADAVAFEIAFVGGVILRSPSKEYVERVQKALTNAGVDS